MVDKVGGAQQASYAQQSQKAQQKEPTRSFADVRKEKAGPPKKAKKKGDKDDDKDAASKAAAEQGAFAQQLQAKLGGPKGAKGKGQKGEGGLDADARGGGAKAAAESAEALLGEGSGIEGKRNLEGTEKAFELKGRDMGRAELKDQTKLTEMKHGETIGRDLEKKIDDQVQDLDDDLKSELQAHLFAHEIGNPLMAQRATEPKPVEAARPVPQIPAAIVDRVVERARFGMNAEGAHEFQVDLKDDVFGGAELKIVTKDGKVQIEMVSDDHKLHAAADQLAKQLKAKGMDVGGVRVLTKSEADAELREARGLDTGGGAAQGARRKGAARGLWDDDEDSLRR